MANKISDETIEYVGILAKLELSGQEKENAKAETLISEMEADLTEDGTKESHSDASDEDLSIQKETMDKKSAEQEENEGGQEV